MELTAQHWQVLATIAMAGASRKKLGDLASSRELAELINAGFVTYEPAVLQETHSGQRTDVWYLTRAGAVVIGLSPDFLRGA